MRVSLKDQPPATSVKKITRWRKSSALVLAAGRRHLRHTLAVQFFIVRRVLWAIALLFIVSAVIFLIFYVLPSADPAVLRAGRNAGTQQIANIRHSLGLDKPIYTQYLVYMRQVFLHFDFGYSYQYNVPVRQLIVSRLPATAWLVIGGMIVWLAIGLTVGIISASR